MPPRTSYTRSTPALPELPTGTVTFLVTDIEGSTTRWEQHREAMQAALARHDAILREAMEGHGGIVFKTVGDAFYAVFTRAPMRCARPWPPSAPCTPSPGRIRSVPF